MLKAEGTRKRHRRFYIEPLERRHLLTGGVVISEFVASNDSTLNDRDGDSSDWIELFNTSEKSINLDGWYLTDDLDELDKWQLPSVAIDPGEFEIIFASDKDRINPAAQLHTNFRLSARGESLALIEPDGETIAHGYDRFPQQFTDIAFGLSTEVDPLDISVPGYLLEPTPGKPNGITSEQPPSGNVSYSISGRTFAESFDLVLSSPARDAVIRYTTDGSIPDEDADQYVEPIRVATSMRIRARAFQPGRSAGPVNSQAYIALADDLLENPIRWRYDIVRELHTGDRAGEWRGGRQGDAEEISDGLAAAIEALLSSALHDTASFERMSGTWDGIRFSDPRICDLAAHVLARRWPDRYRFDLAAGAAEREAQRLRLIERSEFQ